MGLGKTVMTIALILKSPRRCSPDNQVLVKNAAESTASSKPKGGTLIICPMALLSQWKVNLSCLLILRKLKLRMLLEFC